jgi:hypothetical protein
LTRENSPTPALLDLGAYYNEPLIAWVPDQEQIFSQVIV